MKESMNREIKEQMMTHENQKFTDQLVVADYNRYHHCTLKNCYILFHGNGPTVFLDCVFDACKFGMGDQAAKTLNFLSEIYHSNPAGAQLVENTFGQIRKGGYR